MGIAHGPWAGIRAGLVLSGALLGSRLVDGFDLGRVGKRYELMRYAIQKGLDRAP